MEPDAKRKMSRRASLISKEDMAKLQIQNFASIDTKAVDAILGLSSECI